MMAQANWTLKLKIFLQPTTKPCQTVEITNEKQYEAENYKKIQTTIETSFPMEELLNKSIVFNGKITRGDSLVPVTFRADNFWEIVNQIPFTNGTNGLSFALCDLCRIGVVGQTPKRSVLGLTTR
jgi:hypothetical protein